MGVPAKRTRKKAQVEQLAALRARVASLEAEVAHLRSDASGTAADSYRELLQAVLESVETGIVACNAQGVLTLFNRATREFHGLPEEPLPADKWAEHYDLFHGDGVTRMKTAEVPLFRALEEGSVSNAEMVIAPKGGSKRLIFASGRAMRGHDGKVLGAVVAMHDVTALQRSKLELEQRVLERTRALRESEARVAGILESIQDGFFALDSDWRFIYLNSAAERLVGTRREDLLGRSHWDVYAPTLGTVMEREYRRAVQEKTTVEFDSFYQPWQRWFAIKASPTREGGLSIYLRDVTEQKRAEEAVRESEERFRQAIDSMPQLVWSSRPDGYHDLYNKQWFEYTGLTYEDTKGDEWNGVFHPDDQERARERWKQSLLTGEPYEIEYRCRRFDGHYRWFLGRARPIRDEAGLIVRWFGTCTDMHRQKEAEEALRYANSDLESFAFAAAHDLQEPLRMVISYTQLLSNKLGDSLDQDAKQFMAQIVHSAKRTSMLLQDLLAYTEVSRQPEEQNERVDLNSGLEATLDDLGVAIAESKATITFDQLPFVSGHEAHFVQLFQNLIGNAIKYRSERAPEIHISVRRNAMDWVVSIADNGMGIDPGYHQEVFGVFRRLHGKKIPGTGIGLAICQRVVERQGGRIWVESEGRGMGATFIFTLPIVE